MAITTNTLGPNSKEIVFSGGNAHVANDVANAVGAALATMGWTVHDASVRVYTAMCRDGVTPKYVQVFTSNTNMYLRVYETWNAVTHVGTNEAVHHVDAVVNTYSASYTAAPTTNFSDNTVLDLVAGGSIVLLASPRYALMYNKDVNLVTKANLHGCVEWSRDSVDANSSPFGFMSQRSILGQRTDCKAGSGGTGTSFAANQIFPVKTRNGVGAHASKHVTLSVGPYDTALFSGTTSNGGLPLSTVVPTTNDAVTNLPSSYTFEVVSNKTLYVYSNSPGTESQNTGSALYKDFVFGRIYGLKLIAGNTNSWVDGDTVSLAVDADGFQVPTGGTPTQHHVTSVANLPKFKLVLPV